MGKIYHLGGVHSRCGHVGKSAGSLQETSRTLFVSWDKPAEITPGRSDAYRVIS